MEHEQFNKIKREEFINCIEVVKYNTIGRTFLGCFKGKRITNNPQKKFRIQTEIFNILSNKKI